MRPRSRYTFGAAIVVSGALALSFSGLIIRQVEVADAWQILFFRSLGMIITLTLFLSVTHGRKMVSGFVRSGWRGWSLALLIGPSFALYTLALTITSVAEVSFVVTTLPLFTALLAWIFLRERVRLGTWVAIIVVLLGVSIMVSDSFNEAGNVLGILAALGVTVTLAITIILIRSGRGVDMTPATWAAGFIGLAIAVALTGGDIGGVPVMDIVWGSLMGVTLGFGFGCYAIGTRHVPAAQVAILVLLEQALNPVWAWAGAGETPTVPILVGGLIIVAAVSYRAVVGVMEENRAANTNVPVGDD